MDFVNTVIQGNCLDVLKTLPDEIIDCCVTSPPYYGLRDYGTGTWVGGDPDCPHRRTTKRSDKTITGHKQDELEGNVGDAIYKTVCPLCGAVREDNQIGLEETPEEYVQKLVDVFHEVKRVMKDDGTLWLNIGDSYVAKPPSHRDTPNMQDKSYGNWETELGYEKSSSRYKALLTRYKNKDLIGIPWMLAFALRKDGWYLRQDIIWHKPNPMPESVKDRCTKSHEYVFLLSKNPRYYFDNNSIQENAVTSEVYESKEKKSSKYENTEQESSVRQGIHRDRGNDIVVVRKRLPSHEEFVSFIREHTTVDILADNTEIPRTKIEHWFRKDEDGFSYPSVEDWEKIRDYVDDWSEDFKDIDERMTDVTYETDAVLKNFNGKRNKRDVWSVTTKAVKEAHFATFPEELIEPCILAGCRKGGIVLDPFFGSGTTGRVATKHNRNYLGIELNPEYIEISKRRTDNIQLSLDGFFDMN